MSLDNFDYIIVGAGAAGCVLANRLTADASVSVCLLEAGGKDSNPYIRMPAGFVKTLYGDGLYWPFMTAPSDSINGRQVRVPQGRVLGGSSSINGMVYNRGQRADFDTWAQFGNRGWGFDDLIPYFKRSERRIGAGDDSVRGRDGETPVTDIDWFNPVCEAFLASAEGLGIPRNPDYNSGVQFGAGYYQRFIHRGRRVSAADAFLRPALGRPNLNLRTRVQVLNVTLAEGRATGVRYRNSRGVEVEVTARREVLLSSGAVNSPKLLQLSGIGPPALLGEFDIPVRRALPGVGENLRDHFSARLVARARNVRTARLGLQSCRESSRRSP